MGQAEVLERLYYVPNLSAEDLSIVLKSSLRSIQHSLQRLKKIRYIKRTDKGYILTERGRDFAERYYL